MAINYEQLQSTMGEQNRRWTYTKNQLESPYLRKRAQEMERFKLKEYTKSAKQGGGPQTPETPPSSTSSRKPVRVEVIGDLEAARKQHQRSRGLQSYHTPAHTKMSAESTASKAAPSPSSVQGPVPSSGFGHVGQAKGMSQSPTNFRAQSTAGLSHFGEGRPQEGWTSRMGNKLINKANQIGQRRAASGGSSSETMSAARGVTHSTGESWAARTGKSLLAKADQIGTQRAVQSRTFSTPSVSAPSAPSSGGWAARTGNKLVNKANEIGRQRLMRNHGMGGNGQGGRSF